MLLTYRNALQALALVTHLNLALARRLPAVQKQHEPLHGLRKRQVETVSTIQDMSAPPTMGAPASGPVETYTIITPSPAASPIAITSQSQVITTYVPVMTLCPPSGQMQRRQEGGNAQQSSPPYVNATAAPFRDSTATGCITAFQASRTTVCHTTLNGLATRYTVTVCDQDITFSSEYGYSPVTAAPTDATLSSPPSSIETLTTYFRAPWDQLTDGLTPSDVVERVCSPVATSSQQCIDISEAWSTVPMPITAASSTPIDIHTTVSGPSVVSIGTARIDVTNTITVISTSTIIVNQYTTMGVSTVKSTISTSTEDRQAPETSTNTVTVFPAPPNPSDGTTSTTTIKVTSTITMTDGTTTVTTSMPTASSSTAATIASAAMPIPVSQEGSTASTGR